VKTLLILVAVFVLVVGGYAAYAILIGNPATVRELRDNPTGERAQRVMLLSLPSGKELPINYLREGPLVFAGSDGPWWKELRGKGAAVEMWIQGEAIRGHARAIEDDPDYQSEVFRRLRPSAPEFLQTTFGGGLAGTLVVIQIESESEGP
jgi:hypothetical protein